MKLLLSHSWLQPDVSLLILLIDSTVYFPRNEGALTRSHLFTPATTGNFFLLYKRN